MYLVYLFLTIFNVTASESFVIKEINILGLNRTSNIVITSELNFSAGDTVTAEDIAIGIQNLKNTQIFSDVKFDLVGDDQKVLNVEIKEKWTLIPIFKFGSAGGTDFYQIGVYDVNAFGKYIEIGAQYENFEGRDAGVVWFRNPRFLGQRLKIGVDVWEVLRESLLYNDEGEIEGGYVLERSKISLFVEKELYKNLTLGINYEYLDDYLSTDMLSTKIQGYNTANGFSFGDKTKTNIPKVYIQVGQLQYQNYLVEGMESKLQYEYGIVEGDSELNFHRYTAETKYFYLFNNSDNLAFRGFFQSTTSNQAQHYVEVGGLDDVRGYFENNFKSDRAFVFNVEYRKILTKLKKILLQGVAFTDAGFVHDSFLELTDRHEKLLSYGLGIRFIAPQIYRLNFRIDYAINTTSEEFESLSFGLQHFF